MFCILTKLGKSVLAFTSYVSGIGEALGYLNINSFEMPLLLTLQKAVQ